MVRKRLISIFPYCVFDAWVCSEIIIKRNSSITIQHPLGIIFLIENFSTWKAFLNQLSNGQDFLGHFYFQEFEHSHEDFHKFH